MGGSWSRQEGLCIQQNLTPVVYRIEVAEALDRAAAEAGKLLDIHIKIDTGMGRLGVRCDELLEFCAALKKLQNLRVDGLMTHLASADDQTKHEYTEKQLQRIQLALNAVRELGFLPTYVHAANSAVLSAFGHSGSNLFRPAVRLSGECVALRLA